MVNGVKKVRSLHTNLTVIKCLHNWQEFHDFSMTFTRMHWIHDFQGLYLLFSLFQNCMTRMNPDCRLFLLFNKETVYLYLGLNVCLQSRRDCNLTVTKSIHVIVSIKCGYWNTVKTFFDTFNYLYYLKKFLLNWLQQFISHFSWWCINTVMK